MNKTNEIMDAPEIKRTLSANTIIQTSTESNSKINGSGSDYATRIGNIIAKVRLGKGWSPNSPADQKTAAAVWLEILADALIPGEAIPELYKRANQTIQNALAAGREAPEMSANLLAAQWHGGLRAELEQKRIDEKRYLPETAVSNCPKCFGSGFELVKDNFGYSGARKCDHIAPPAQTDESSEATEPIEQTQFQKDVEVF